MAKKKTTGLKRKQHAGFYKRITDTKSFIETAHRIHENKYKYDKTIFKHSMSKVVIECPLHGYFTQIPLYHTGGRGCPFCETDTHYPDVCQIVLVAAEPGWFSIGVTNNAVKYASKLKRELHYPVEHLRTWNLHLPEIAAEVMEDLLDTLTLISKEKGNLGLIKIEDKDGDASNDAVRFFVNELIEAIATTI